MTVPNAGDAPIDPAIVGLFAWGMAIMLSWVGSLLMAGDERLADLGGDE